MQHENFPDVDIKGLIKHFKYTIHNEDLIIPPNKGRISGDQTDHIFDYFQNQIYARINGQTILNIGVGLGLADGLMLLTPVDQLNIVEVSKKACAKISEFIKPLEKFWLKKDILYAGHKRLKIANKDINDPTFNLPEKKYDTVMCFNVSHFMKPLNSMLC
ncbi:MAG: hypothetical protein Q8S21_03685 [Candidatus Paracaedibacteraceae bacterium]|nr:hypothetical protein [Candidatus Paracaedibacteraceae bacterium]